MPSIELPAPATASLTGGFWGSMAARHRGPALDHQWQQLEATGAIECFEVAAGVDPEGFVAKDFTSDSDVHKWIEAVARIAPERRSPQLAERFERIVDLVEATQQADGYCNTWIQVHFPSGRWRDLETEHEQYTLGHLIEAGVSAFETSGDQRLLAMARAAADLLVERFARCPAHEVAGHEEVEIALVRLHRATGDAAYQELAVHLIDQRGRARHRRRRFLRTAARTGIRVARWARRRRAHARRRPSWRRPERPAGLEIELTPAIAARTAASFVSGRWAQTDRPVRRLTHPSGHAVCFQYLHTAAAMLARDLGDATLRAATEQAWERLVTEHLFVSGGCGAYPGWEGFGAPYDLDPQRAYAETCASVAGIQWNRELGLLTGEARFDDLLEWQLLNGAAVGMSVDGTAYHYNNPLQVGPGFARRTWYPIPCCPSNLSRTWGSLATLATSLRDGELCVHQYVSSRATVGPVTVEIDSGLPWDGEATIRIDAVGEGAGGRGLPRRLALRVPSWAPGIVVHLDGSVIEAHLDPAPPARTTASGLDPWQARWARIDLPAGAGAGVEVRVGLEMPVRLLRQHDRVPRVGGRVALARGPLLYCLEGVDHPDRRGAALTEVELDRDRVVARFDPELLGGAVELRATATDGRALRFVPYFLWGNRGAEGMTAFVR